MLTYKTFNTHRKMGKHYQLSRLLILLTGVMFAESGSVYPEELSLQCPKICDCNIWYDRLNCSGRNAIGDFDYKELPYLVIDLDLSNNSYRQFSKDLGNYSLLKRLNYSRNFLTSIDLDLCQMKKLRILDLSRNNFSRVDGIANLSQLRDLQVLYLSNNKDFQHLDGLKSTTLRELYADNCNIQYFDSDTLAGLPKLLILTLSGNNLKYVAYPRYTNLGFLDLSRTGLKSIATINLSGLKNLLYLKITENVELKYTLRTLKHKEIRILIVEDYTYIDRSGLPSLQNFSGGEIEDIEKIVFSKSRDSAYNFNELIYSLEKKNIDASRFLNLWNEPQLPDLSDEIVLETSFENNQWEEEKSVRWKSIGQNICYVVMGILVVAVSAWAIYRAWRLEITLSNTSNHFEMS